MTQSFAVGEIAIVQNMVGNWACWNGAEVKIASPLCRRRLLNQMTGVSAVIDAYEVRFADGYLTDFPPSYLRKKRPPQQYTGELRIRELFDQSPVEQLVPAEIA